MDEEWRDIAGYEGAYQVSSLGRVRSLPGWHRGGRVLKLGLSGRVGNQYYNVVLHGRYTKSVHVLVAEAFIGPRPPKTDVCHNNGNRLDNRVENLRYGTRAENMADRNEHGTNTWAQRTHCKNGHEYTPENTRVTATRRWCRACDRERWARKPHPRRNLQ